MEKYLTSLLNNIEQYQEKNGCLYKNKKLLKYLGNKKIKKLKVDAEEICIGAFSDVFIDELIINDGVNVIQDFAFENCNIKKIYLPKSLNKINLSNQDVYNSVVILDENINKNVKAECKKSSKIKVYLETEYDEVKENQKLKEQIEKLNKELSKVLIKKFYKKVYDYDVLYNDNDLESLQMKCEKDILYIISNDVSSNKLSIRQLNFQLTKISYLTHLTPSDTKDVIEKINVKLEELKLCEQQYGEALSYFYDKEYLKAYNIFIQIESYKFSSNYINSIINIVKQNYVLELDHIYVIELIEEAHKYIKEFKIPELKSTVKLYNDIIKEYNYIDNYIDSSFLESVSSAIKYDSIYNEIKIFINSIKFSSYTVIKELLKEKLEKLAEKLTIKTKYDLEKVKEFRYLVKSIDLIGMFIDKENAFKQLALQIAIFKFHETFEIPLLNNKIKCLEILNEYYDTTYFIDTAKDNKKELEEKLRLENIQKAKEEKLRKEQEEKEALKLKRKENLKKFIKFFFIGLLILIGVAFVGFLIFRGIIEIIDLSSISVNDESLLISWIKTFININ